MPDKKIIKAFKHCAIIGECNGCPSEKDKAMCLSVDKQIIDLIYRQKEEIERLEGELAITREYIHKNGLEWDLVSHLREKVGENIVDR